MTATYDAAMLAEMGYGDTGEAVIEMTEAEVRELAQAVFAGGTCRDTDTIESMIEEIETARL
jgi:hypothetical protein